MNKKRTFELCFFHLCVSPSLDLFHRDGGDATEGRCSWIRENQLLQQQ